MKLISNFNYATVAATCKLTRMPEVATIVVASHCSPVASWQFPVASWSLAVCVVFGESG